MNVSRRHVLGGAAALAAALLLARAASTPDLDVAIVGGGMVGLTLAAALGGAGIETAVVDAQAPETRLAAPYDGRASAIALG